MEDTSHNYSATIAYIVPHSTLNNAIPINISRRKRLLESLGCRVILVQHSEGKFLKNCIVLWKLKKILDCIIIRIDGSCLLDKYTLNKILLSDVPIVWEIHGFPEERFAFSHDIYAQWFVWKNNVKRRLLSGITSASICVSHELMKFAKKKLYIRKSAVIPNFINTEEYQHHPKNNPLARFIRNDSFLVLWGGDAGLPWNATDIMQKAAKRIAGYDKNVLFVFIGSNYWYPVQNTTNIILLNPITHAQFTTYVARSNVCLALYRSFKFFPFYLYPMKLLDYLLAGKPIIASNLGAISTIITHEINGLLTNNSVDAIVNDILKLKRHKNLARKLSRNARRTAIVKCNSITAEKRYRELFISLEILR